MNIKSIVERFLHVLFQIVVIENILESDTIMCAFVESKSERREGRVGRTVYIVVVGRS